MCLELSYSDYSSDVGLLVLILFVSGLVVFIVCAVPFCSCICVCAHRTPRVAVQRPQAAVQRTDTPEATVVDIPAGHPIDAVPTATATGVRTMETVDALVILPPVTSGEMEAVPDAQLVLPGV